MRFVAPTLPEIARHLEKDSKALSAVVGSLGPKGSFYFVIHAIDMDIDPECKVMIGTAECVDGCNRCCGSFRGLFQVAAGGRVRG
jgi:hypothetical protein